MFLLAPALASDIPIADVHVHYSHDSVELTPPDRVIELMREAQLKFALVSSSDDKGTQLLLKAAPDLIIPGLRPYRRRGETGTWATDPAALEYVERLLRQGPYATIGEFHLYGNDALLDIPQRIVELADEHNLILHAHSDAEAVEGLLASSDTVKVIWAHGGFDDPEAIGNMLRKHDRLWADLAFRSEVGSGGSLSDEWLALFEEFPTRIMLGTDTYTPERIYFIPEHASGARSWLEALPPELAAQLAWKNAYDLLMPVWEKNRQNASLATESAQRVAQTGCIAQSAGSEWQLGGAPVNAVVRAASAIPVGQAFAVDIELCAEQEVALLAIDATMPAHGHGMNYKPEIVERSHTPQTSYYRAEGLLFHMPGEWEWSIKVQVAEQQHTLTALANVQ
jgi:hypothetical protein